MEQVALGNDDYENKKLHENLLEGVKINIFNEVLTRDSVQQDDSFGEKNRVEFFSCIWNTEETIVIRRCGSHKACPSCKLTTKKKIDPLWTFAMEKGSDNFEYVWKEAAEQKIRMATWSRIKDGEICGIK